jgi:hypothetical protein
MDRISQTVSILRGNSKEEILYCCIYDLHNYVLEYLQKHPNFKIPWICKNKIGCSKEHVFFPHDHEFTINLYKRLDNDYVPSHMIQNGLSSWEQNKYIYNQVNTPEFNQRLQKIFKVNLNVTMSLSECCETDEGGFEQGVLFTFSLKPEVEYQCGDPIIDKMLEGLPKPNVLPEEDVKNIKDNMENSNIDFIASIYEVLAMIYVTLTHSMNERTPMKIEWHLCYVDRYGKNLLLSYPIDLFDVIPIKGLKFRYCASSIYVQWEYDSTFDIPYKYIDEAKNILERTREDFHKNTLTYVKENRDKIIEQIIAMSKFNKFHPDSRDIFIYNYDIEIVGLYSYEFLTDNLKKEINSILGLDWNIKTEIHMDISFCNSVAVIIEIPISLFD